MPVEQGRLLTALAAGASGRIGETGTGCGVGLAWLVSGPRPGVEVVSVERDLERYERVGTLFADRPDVTIIHGDWTAVDEYRPFDLLVLDGGGNGKRSGAADPERLLAPGGLLIIDDFTPLTGFPPMYQGEIDRARLDWLEHPALMASEVRLASDLATIIATRRPLPGGP